MWRARRNGTVKGRCERHVVGDHHTPFREENTVAFLTADVVRVAEEDARPGTSHDFGAGARVSHVSSDTERTEASEMRRPSVAHLKG